jgi:hypothetical protein
MDGTATETGARVSQLVDQFGAVVGGLGALPAVRAFTTFAAVYVVLLWLACAWWVFHDLRRRHVSAVAPYLGATFVVLASPLAFPFAVAVYRITRPRETLSEARYRRLETRLADLQLEGDLRCPDCAAPVDAEWLLCPACQAPLGYRCVDCARTMATDWSLCAWCGAEIEEPVALDVPARAADGVAAASPADDHDGHEGDRAPVAPEAPAFQPQPEVVTI